MGNKIPQNLQEKLANLSPEMLEKVIARAEKARATRFSKLVYNHYRQHRLVWQYNTARQLLQENKIIMPEYSKTEKEFEPMVIEKQKKLAANGNQQAIDTLAQANITL